MKTKNSLRINVRLTQEQADFIHNLSKEHEISISDVMRLIVKSAMSQKTKLF